MKNRKSPGDRLILIICRHRPAATKREIARAHLTGADLEQAKRETEGLVEFEPIHRKGSHKRSWAARLTAEGIWRAIRLTSGYDAGLAAAALAAIDIRALLARLEDERNPLALEIAADRQDAHAYRAQQADRKEREIKARRLVEAAEKILSRPRRTLSARHYAKLQAFLASRRVPGSFEHLAPQTSGAAKIPARPDIVAPPVGARVFPRATPTGVKCRECGLDTAAHRIGCSRFGQPSVPVFGSKSTPMAVPQTTVQQLSPEDARKAELKKFCVLCKDGIGGEHDCSRFQLT